MLIGRVGKDPEVRYMPNGDAVANFTLATSETYKDKAGEKQETTTWHNLTCYRRLGEIAGQYAKKGKQVYVEGKITTRKWQDKEGKDRYTTEIIVDELKLLGSSDSGERSQPEQRSEPARQRPAAQPARPVDEFEDDLPF
jgi:single-strand DNA-binding protein